jgi:hypothetical protein
MTKVFLSFEVDNEDELLQLVLNYVIKQKKPPSWLGDPLTDVALQNEAEAREAYQKEIDEDDAEHVKGNGAEPEPAPEPAPKRARAPRAPRVSVAPPPVSPAPAVAPAPPVDLPPLDTLKAIVTNAVRLAQKGEGSKKILDLLPTFKDTTGLAFVMNALDEHRPALYDLVQAAGLPVV